MALKTIMLRRKIDLKKAELEDLRAKDAEFETREAEINKSIEEATTQEEQDAVDSAISEFEADKQEHVRKIDTLSGEISDLEKTLAEEERSIEEIMKHPENREQKIERSSNMPTINIRSLPMSQRAFDALPEAQRSAILAQEETKSFLTQLRSMKGQNRGISGADLTIPVAVLDLISENMYRYSKLLNRVRVRNVSGTTRQTIAGTIPEAVWTEMCAAINEMTFVFNQVTLDGYKVAGYVPVCNSILEDSDIALASWIVEMLSESIGLAIDKAILYGKGAASKMPLGIVTRLAQSAKPGDYPANAPAWEDLHTTNVIKLDASLTGAEFWSALMVAAGNTFSRYSRGDQFWAMNSKTYALLKSKSITFAATGDFVANVYGTLPIINGNIDLLEFIPDGDIIGGYGDLYLFAQRAGMTLESSREVQFIQDNTVFRGKQRADGMPIIPRAFVAINISGAEVTTAVDFAADSANDVDLSGLTGLTLAPSFDPGVTTYAATADNASATVTATAANPAATIVLEYNGKMHKNGSSITWVADGVSHPLTATVSLGYARKVYTVNVTKAGA